MKPNFLDKFEEKFYFKTSQYFWHVLVGITALALLIGLLALLWGISPSIKPYVKKEKYPEPVKVTLEEIQSKIKPKTDESPKTEQPVQSSDTSQKGTEEEIPEKIDPSENNYQASIDSMKVLLPPAKYRWKTKGHWEQSWYRKKWVVDILGISDRLKYLFKNVHANNFHSKDQLLKAYISLISKFPESERLAVLKSAIGFSKTDVNTAIENAQLLETSTAHYSVEKADFIQTLATFGKKNPRDGRKFIEYSNSIITNFQPEIRETMLTTLVQSYYNYFNLIQKQQEATDLFLNMANSFVPETQPKALTEYYKLFIAKNRTREQEIHRIENEHQYAIQRAESAVSNSRREKAQLRGVALKIIGASIIFIAFVAMFLVLLSIQRNVKGLREVSSLSK